MRAFDRYQGQITVTFDVTITAPSQAEAALRLSDVAIVLTDRFTGGEVFRPFAPKRIAGRPLVHAQSALIDGPDRIESEATLTVTRTAQPSQGAS